MSSSGNVNGGMKKFQVRMLSKQVANPAVKTSDLVAVAGTGRGDIVLTRPPPAKRLLHHKALVLRVKNTAVRKRILGIA